MIPLAARLDREELELLGDAELVARICAGEPALYELVMRRYNRRLFRIARGILGHDGEAEDAVQETWIQAYSRLPQFRGPGGFPSWLYRIATNQALMRRRRQPAVLATLEVLAQPANQEAAMADPQSPGNDPLAAAHGEQLRRLFEHAVDQLPEVYRVAFVLREVEEMTVAETAALLGIGPETVKTRVHRARRLLQRNLSGELSAALRGAFAFDGERCDRLVARVFERLRDPGSRGGGSRPWPLSR